MPGLIRRTLLIGGVAAAAGGVALWRWRSPGDRELSYGGDPAQVLDIRSPRAGGAAPVLVIFHGGDFATGDKADVTVWPEWLEAGIAVVRSTPGCRARRNGRRRPMMPWRRWCICNGAAPIWTLIPRGWC